MQDASVGRDPADFRPVIRAVRRWLGPLAGAVMIGGLAGFGVSKLLPPEYESTAQVYLTAPASQTASPGDLTIAPNLAPTYVQLAASDVVLQRAMARLGLVDLPSFKGHTQVAQVRDTSLIAVSFRERDPLRAAAAANAIAESLIQQSRQLQSSLQGTTADRLDKQVGVLANDIASLDSQIAAIRASLAAPPSGQAEKRTADQARLLQLEGAREAKRQGLADLAATAERTRAAAAREQSNVTLWQAATPPTEATTPRVGINALLGALGAGLIGLTIVGIIGYRDDRLLDLRDAAVRLGLTPLGELRRVSGKAKAASSLFVRDDPFSPMAESFRSLRTNIWFANASRTPPRIMLVTSAESGEGKSLVSANLAIAFAQAGLPTILVDADLRHPTQHVLFGLKGGVGLTDLIAGAERATTDQSTRIPLRWSWRSAAPSRISARRRAPSYTLDQFRVGEQLFVIPSGPLPPNPAEIASSDGMSSVLHQLAAIRQGSVMIVDSSPILPVTDSIALASMVDGCLLVIDASRTAASSVHRGIESLRIVHGVVIGAVLNNMGAEYRRHRGPSARGADLVETRRPAERGERATTT